MLVRVPEFSGERRAFQERHGNPSRMVRQDSTDAYEWPTPDDLITEMDEIVADTLRVGRAKSFQLEILGPSEYSEYSCSPGKTSQGRGLDQVSHRFDFSVLTLLDPRKAEMIQIGRASCRERV